MRRRAALFSAWILMAGCAAPPGDAPPPATPPPPAPPVPAKTPAPAKADKAPPPALPSAPSYPLLAEKPPPLTRSIVTMTIPGVKGDVLAVGGRSSRDMWFLSNEEEKGMQPTIGRLHHFDGRRVDKHERPCKSYGYGDVLVSDHGVVAIGYNLYFRGVPGRLFSRRTGPGAWSCETPRGPMAEAFVSGGHSWQWVCEPDRSDCELTSDAGLKIVLPGHDPSFKGKTEQPQAVWMRGDDDGWMARAAEPGGPPAILRWNGVTWIPEVALDAGLAVKQLWEDASGVLWIAAEIRKMNVLFRYDGHRVEPLPAPPGFEVNGLHATGPREVWIIGGGRTLYQWDGKQLHQGEAPFAIMHAWAAPGGELWLTSSDNKGPGPGVVAHTTAPGGEVR